MKLTGLNCREIICGVYVIKHIESSREYIGSSVNLYKRLIKHKSDLNKCSHHSSKLQNAWNKYGEHEFSFLILEIVSDPAAVLLAEQRWLDERIPFYNICKFARNRLGFKATEETKLRQSKALRGMKRTPEQIENIRKSQIGKKLSSEHRAKCGRKGQKKPEGFGEKLRIANTGRKMSESGIEKMAMSKRKKYIFIDPENKEYVATGLRKFCLERGLNPSSMSGIANKKPHYIQHRGWKCRFYEQFSPPIVR